MKKYTNQSTAPRGSLPPQLFKYIDMSRISQAVARFRKFRVVITDTYNIIKKNRACRPLNFPQVGIFYAQEKSTKTRK